jgi:hypothetical protein
MPTFIIAGSPPVAEELGQRPCALDQSRRYPTIGAQHSANAVRLRLSGAPTPAPSPHPTAHDSQITIGALPQNPALIDARGFRTPNTTVHAPKPRGSHPKTSQKRTLRAGRTVPKRPLPLVRPEKREVHFSLGIQPNPELGPALLELDRIDIAASARHSVEGHGLHHTPSLY